MGGWWGIGSGQCDYCVTPVQIGLGFGFWTALGLGLGLRELDLGLGLDNNMYLSLFNEKNFLFILL